MTKRKRRKGKEGKRRKKRRKEVSIQGKVFALGKCTRRRRRSRGGARRPTRGDRARARCACVCHPCTYLSSHTHVRRGVLNYAACIFSGLFGGSQSLAGNPASLRAHRVTRLEVRKTRENFSISQQAAPARDLAERQTERGVGREIGRAEDGEEGKKKRNHHPSRVEATRNRK